QASNAESWTGQLIAAARESRPNNPRLLLFAEDYGLCAASPELERRVREDLPFIDIAWWRKRLGEIEGQVCRIEIATDNGVGTGCLLGPDTATPSYHVVKDEPQADLPEFKANTPLSIVQHPNTASLKLAFDTKALIALNDNKTRIRYRTNTDPGSSGAPVFDGDWRLVALHPSGDRSIVPKYNQG